MKRQRRPVPEVARVLSKTTILLATRKFLNTKNRPYSRQNLKYLMILQIVHRLPVVAKVIIHRHGNHILRDDPPVSPSDNRCVVSKRRIENDELGSAISEFLEADDGERVTFSRISL